ncbi:MAG: indolepyruvate ferredoxin oxidoreductase subunit alpha [Bradymonadaceae bacterium]
MSDSRSHREHPILALRPGERPLLLGNQAIVRGALEAGVSVVTGYPGTPSSEIPDTFYALARQAGIYFEYSTNEKVALEVGAGAAYSGARTLVSMKHVGLNVALEPLMSLAYTGVPAGLVVVTADDPGCHSSQNEQDNRLIARLANLPCLEPATAEEARRLTILAFELSERFELPVLLRTTTRISHTRGIVSIGERRAPQKAGGFKKDFRRYLTMPPISLHRHGVLLETMDTFAEAVDEMDELVTESGCSRVGIISSGVCRSYVHDALAELSEGSEVRHLELAITHPLPRRRCVEFMKKVDRLLVVEELEPVIENELYQWVAREKLDVDIWGKGSGVFSRQGEYTPEGVVGTVASFLGRQIADKESVDPWSGGELPSRPPALCAGCPHRASFYALKVMAGDDAIFAGDIGCYTLGGLPPFRMQDTMLCMGASTACGGGLALTNDKKKVVATIGDSTFFHSGIAGLVNALRNGHDYTLAILDNSTTAMTGHQPHAGTTDQSRGRPVSIEAIVRSLGVEKVEVVNPLDLPSITQTARECLDYPGVAVMICREPCPLYQIKRAGPADESVVYRVDQSLCKACGFKSQGLHCGVETCSATELWRSKRKIGELAVGGKDPVRMEVPPCGAACPVNICVHGYVANIAAGDYRAALETIRGRNPLPSVCSRVCHQPCEAACYRSTSGGAVQINRLKRFVCDWATEHAEEIRPPVISTRHEQRVAVIGSGPGGLSCAHDLALRGYDVTVFEQMPAPGGLLRYGIPPYRLPAEVLDRDLAWIAELGVAFRCGVTVGVDVSLDDLRGEGFEAFFLATGAWAPTIPKVLDCRHPRVRDALSFLRRVNQGEEERSDGGGRVVVVGGGNTGIDTARCLRRLGYGPVTIIEQSTLEACRAIPEEIEAARSEGVDFLFDTLVEEVVIIDGAVQGLKIGVEGRHPTLLAANLIFAATGQGLDMTNGVLTGLREENEAFITVSKEDGQTRMPGVFAAGDAVEGPGNVIEVIAAAKRVAHGIDRYLAGENRVVEPLHFHDPVAYADQTRYVAEGVSHQPPIEPGHLGPERTRTFSPPEATFTEEEARAEAERCLACGACANCNVCIDHFACVAIYRDEEGRVQVNEALCNGCGVCAELCPNNAYTRVVTRGES